MKIYVYKLRKYDSRGFLKSISGPESTDPTSDLTKMKFKINKVLTPYDKYFMARSLYTMSSQNKKYIVLSIKNGVLLQSATSNDLAFLDIANTEKEAKNSLAEKIRDNATAYLIEAWIPEKVSSLGSSIIAVVWQLRSLSAEQKTNDYLQKYLENQLVNAHPIIKIVIFSLLKLGQVTDFINREIIDDDVIANFASQMVAPLLHAAIFLEAQEVFQCCEQVSTFELTARDINDKDNEYSDEKVSLKADDAGDNSEDDTVEDDTEKKDASLVTVSKSTTKRYNPTTFGNSTKAKQKGSTEEKKSTEDESLSLLRSNNDTQSTANKCCCRIS